MTYINIHTFIFVSSLMWFIFHIHQLFIHLTLGSMVLYTIQNYILSAHFTFSFLTSDLLFMFVLFNVGKIKKMTLDILISWHCWIKLIQCSITISSLCVPRVDALQRICNEAWLCRMYRVFCSTVVLEELLFCLFHVMMHFLVTNTEF